MATWSKAKCRCCQQRCDENGDLHSQGQKVIIDEIQFSEIGYNGFMKNGLILQTNPLVIKTSNGTIEVKKMRTKINKFETEQILY